MLFPMRSLIGFLAFNVNIITAAVTFVSHRVGGSTAHSTLDSALAKANLKTVLAGTGPFTLFAPTNAAFAALPKGTLDNLLLPANLHKLKNVLNYHVVSGKKEAKDLKNGDIITTVQTQKVYVTKTSGSVIFTVSGAEVIQADMEAINGVMHSIDKVLIPSDIVQLAQFGTGGMLAKLVEALAAADLVTTLKGDGPFTVLAPNNEAFTALPSGEFTRLLKPASKAELVSILKYHVVGSSIKAASVTNDQKITTLHAGVITAKKVGTKVTIEGAQVITADIEALNGIIHIIDKVLIPPKANAKGTTAKGTTAKGTAKSANATTVKGSGSNKSASSDASVVTATAGLVISALALRL